MSKFILLMLLCVFFLALARLVEEGSWYYVAVIISGLLIQRDNLKRIWEEEKDKA